MIKGLSEEEKYRLIRPMIGNCDYDENKFPIIRKTPLEAIDWEHLKAVGIQNASPKSAGKNILVTMFRYDHKMMYLWNNPLKYIGMFQGFAAVTTPDFSVYPSMNENEIRHNVYMSRWLGVTWQNYNCVVLPTIGWALPDTYDICLGAVEEGSIVVVSTIGCLNHEDVFLDGFNEMKRRINPPLIIVVGDMIEGMTGKFLNFKYTDCFAKDQRFEQLRFEGIPRIFTVKEVKTNGLQRII